MLLRLFSARSLPITRNSPVRIDEGRREGRRGGSQLDDEFELKLTLSFSSLFLPLRFLVDIPTDVWESYLFHYVSEGGVIYSVLANDAVGR